MDYNVNKNTLLVIPAGEKKCKIVEDNKTYNLNNTSFKVIENSCEYFGVSYKSRLKGSQKLIKTRYKVPIVIEETSKLVFFPISSTTKQNTLWISYSNIFDFYKSAKKGHTVVRFKNGYKIEIPISFYSFNNQFLKASRLTAVLLERTSKIY